MIFTQDRTSIVGGGVFLDECGILFLLNSGIVIFGFVQILFELAKTVYVQKATSQDAVIKISLSFKRENLKMEVDSCQSVKP